LWCFPHRAKYQALERRWPSFANSIGTPFHEEVAKQLNVSVPAVKTLIHRLRQRNTAIVREEIMRTVSDAADLEAESHELCQALIAAEGQILP
jgi:hypothetical protein